jgi:thiol-disulfide isomerase/thioredoxin
MSRTSWVDAFAARVPLRAIRGCLTPTEALAPRRVPKRAATTNRAGLRISPHPVLVLIGAAMGLGLMPQAALASLPALPQVLVQVQPPTAAPPLHFTTADERSRTLAHYRQKAVVLNVWATWCVPCRAEMPALDRLAGLVAPYGIMILPVSVNSGGPTAVQEFYTAHHITHLPILLDPNLAIPTALDVVGIPATILIDREGRIVGRVEGAVKWDAPASVALLRRMLGAAQ